MYAKFGIKHSPKFRSNIAKTYRTYSGNVWQIAELKEIGEIKFGELIILAIRIAFDKLKFGWLKFGKSRMTCKLSHRLTFPLYDIKTSDVQQSETETSTRKRSCQ